MLSNSQKGSYVDKMMMRVACKPNGCWLWQGAITKAGYGLMSFAGRLVYVHRLSFEWFHHLLLDGECVLHRCDVRNCIAPRHLFIGTRADNTADMVAKGRGRFSRPKVVCKRGHEFTAENTGRDRRGDRYCRACSRYLQGRWRAKQRQQRLLL